jgi:hypothetical protein
MATDSEVARFDVRSVQSLPPIAAAQGDQFRAGSIGWFEVI